MLDDGGTSLSAEEHALVVDVLVLAKALCIAMEANKHRNDDCPKSLAAVGGGEDGIRTRV